MKVNGTPYRSIWPDEQGAAVNIIDQTALPHAFEVRRLETLEDAAEAIEVMRVRGAPLIGATAAYGLALAMQDDPGDTQLKMACSRLIATRPTAVNLRWAVNRARESLLSITPGERVQRAWALAGEICDEDVAINHAIGLHGLEIIRTAWQQKTHQQPLHILTHCNAGWLATVDWGTALAPIYRAHDEGIPVHVWVDETRPRNQGSQLTAWELAQSGIPHTVIVDNAGGHLMQHGLVDIVITGTDRTTRCGDVANKIGTYLKALAARDNEIPFYIALPSTTIDWNSRDGIREIPIEERDPREVTEVFGTRVAPEGVGVKNYAFDVTPASYVEAIITERGVARPPFEISLAMLFRKPAES